MKRAILLQTLNLTKSKETALDSFLNSCLQLANSLFEQKKDCRTFMQFHRKVYLASKANTSLGSQTICDIERFVFRAKNGSKAITPKFNVPRNCGTFNAAKTFFVKFTIAPRKQIPIPILKNRNFQRFQSLFINGWQCKTFGLTFSKQIVAYLSEEEVALPQRKNILGIDCNSKSFAVSVITPEGKILKQSYFGKDIWHKRRKIFERKSKLQSLADKGSGRAIKSIKYLKRSERNFVKNRLGEVVREITNMALGYDADIAIEDLKRFNPKGKRFNKEVMRIPFYKFRILLAGRCFDKGITLNIVDSWHTSKWCSHCGALANGHSSSNYSLFKCKCGQIVNSDRKASLAIAIKSLLERSNQVFNQPDFFQISNRQVPVNELMRRNDEIVSNGAVHLEHSPSESQRL
ncbi:MAG: IS200/IS605 family element transposase accessory protein TnpB [Candidatus Diapherotrites archaeon]|nr:IS200/IS605 family element transposase accessory protein TnpB [Candidatus Diapherotrites archaeon]